MLKINLSNKSSIIREKLAVIALSQSERVEVYAALESAERLVDSMFWVYGGIQRLLGRVFLKPGLGA